MCLCIFLSGTEFNFRFKQGGFPMSDSTMLTNSSGQVPSIPGLPGLIDSDTPSSAYTRTGFDGQEYKLVFSDEVRKKRFSRFRSSEPEY